MSRTRFEKSFCCMRVEQLLSNPFHNYTVVIQANGVARIQELNTQMDRKEELCMYLRTFSERVNASLLLSNIVGNTDIEERVAIYHRVMVPKPPTMEESAVAVLEALGYEWTGTEWVQS